jgi:hypothetical protein
MSEPITLNSIERLARALFATLAPVTGVRATGSITIGNDSADDILVPRNTYLMPVVGGQLRDDLLFKTTADVTVLGGSPDPTTVGITSNVGGLRHNLPEGTVFRFNPTILGLLPTATLDADMTDGSDEAQLIRRLAFYEDLDTSSPSADLFASKIGDRGVMLIWSKSDPAEGAMAGLRQGANRASRTVKFWRENFVLYVVVSRLTADNFRRQDGIVITQIITRLLTDRMQNDDGEQLSTVGGGVEITERARLGRSPSHYIYGIRLRVNQTLEASPDGRVFAPWLRTSYGGALPGREPPEPIEDLVIVDALDPMP